MIRGTENVTVSTLEGFVAVFGGLVFALFAEVDLNTRPPAPLRAGRQKTKGGAKRKQRLARCRSSALCGRFHLRRCPTFDAQAVEVLRNC